MKKVLVLVLLSLFVQSTSYALTEDQKQKIYVYIDMKMQEKGWIPSPIPRIDYLNYILEYWEEFADMTAVEQTAVVKQDEIKQEKIDKLKAELNSLQADPVVP